MWLTLITSYQVGLAIVFLIDDSRPHLMSSSAVGRCGPGQVLARETLAASEDHEVGHEHFVDDVNDAVISAYVGPCDGRTVDRNAFQQGGCDCVFHDVAVGS